MYSYLITRSVQMRQQLSVDEILGIVDDQHHDGLGHQVTRSLGHDTHVRVYQVPDRLHLSLQLRIHAGCVLVVSVRLSSQLQCKIIQIDKNITNLMDPD